MANYIKSKKSNNARKRSTIKLSNRTKSILVTVGMILLIFALLMGVRAIQNAKKNNVPEGYELADVKWKSGGISLEDGCIDSNKKFMYSSEINVTTDFKVDVEFGSNISYMVFYYNEVGELLYIDNKTEGEAVEGFKTDYVKSLEDVPVEEGETIDHVRICVEWLDNNDDTLNFFERQKLKKQIEVLVGVEVEETVSEE